MSFSLSGATVLVTGGANLIGSHIVDRLIDRGAGEIRVLDNFIRGTRTNLASATRRRPIRLAEGDIRGSAMVQRAIDGCDFVFHQAAIRITLCAESPRDCIDVMVGGTMNIFEAAMAAGVRKIVWASSASVYGAADCFSTDERHHPWNNRTLYGAAKVMNEGIARSFGSMYGLPAVGLRYFNVYGPRMDVRGAYSEVFIRRLDCIDRDQRPQIHGDGSADIKPIAHLYKTQVYQLAEHPGIPEAIRRRPPTTDTYSMPQTQGEFYFALPYEKMDLCLRALNHDVPPAETARVLGLTLQQVEMVNRDIRSKRQATRYQHQRPLLVEAVPDVGDYSGAWRPIGNATLRCQGRRPPR